MILHPINLVQVTGRSSMGTDGFHLLFFFSIDELARLWNEVGAELRSCLVGGQEQSMEDTMHLPGRRKAKVIGVRGNNLRDFEGAFLTRGQFSGGEVDLQVTRIKPNLCSYFPGGKLCSNSFFNSLSCFSVSDGCLFASSLKDFKSFIKSRKERLSNRRVRSGLEAHHERE